MKTKIFVKQRSYGQVVSLFKIYEKLAVETCMTLTADPPSGPRSNANVPIQTIIYDFFI